MTATTWTTMLITGLRGNAKTLRAVGMMDAFLKSGVPVYASNFNELVLPGVLLFDDPRKWETLPHGSVLFVDEAQKYWRPRAGASKIPDEVMAMETQRHLGVRIVLLTQQPTYIDKHVRTLVDRHEHLIRRVGLPMSQLFAWERCKDEPENPAVVELADQSIYNFETQYYGTYKSAEEHYIKRKLPARVKYAVAGALLAIAGIAWAVSSLKSSATPEAPVVEAHAASEAGEAAEGASPARGKARHRPRTAEEWRTAMAPVIDGAPWSAPIYDNPDFRPEDAPKVYCMIGRQCRCLTEQGTLYRVKHKTCQLIVMSGGILNPYDRRREQRGRAEGAAPSAAMGAVPAPAPALEAHAIGSTGEPPAADGIFRPATVTAAP